MFALSSIFNLFHKKCGQHVENHVDKQHLIPVYNRLDVMPIFYAAFL